MEKLLSTKFSIPQIRKKLVSRPLLIEHLNQGLDGKLTLISAPAGFGKTTLVSEWVDQLLVVLDKDSKSEFQVAWLSLDEGDNDPARFISYFIASINHTGGLDFNLGEVVLKMLQSSQPPPIETMLTSLINEIAEVSDKMIFILDDYHLISPSPIDDVLSYLLEHIPQKLHLVIITRDDPQLPLARLRVSDDLNEVRATDLRFTSTEAVEFLNQVMGLALSEDDVDALESRTEGWIAGLQLAAISLHGQEDVGGFIKSFTGSHRLVLDYLIEEVLEQQSEDIQTFLLNTAVLTRLTGSLCNALTGQQDGQATLEYLEGANLFIVPLDNERRWYRYHHLFGDLLHARLRQKFIERIPELHEKASFWYEENGHIDEAIEHALLGEKFDRAATLIEDNAPIWFKQGEHAIMQRWVAALPKELLRTRPYLNIIHAAVFVSSGQLEEADRLLRIIEGVLKGEPEFVSKKILVLKDTITETERKRLLGMTALSRSYLAFYGGDLDETIRLAEQALSYLPEGVYDWRIPALMILGEVSGLKGDFSSAVNLLSEAMEFSRLEADDYMALVISLRLATNLRIKGELKEVLTLCQRESKRAVENGFSQVNILGGLLTIWGETLAEINQLEDAYQKAKEGIELAGSTTDVNMLGLSNLNYIRVLFSRGNYSEAEKIILKLEKANLETSIPYWIFSQIISWNVRIWLHNGKLNDVSRWVDERWPDPEVLPLDCQEMELMMIVRFLLAKGRHEEALNLLEHLLQLAKAVEQRSKVIEIMLLQALTLQAKGDSDQAVTRLEQTLALAEPDGFIRTFVDEGPALEALLKKVKVERERLKEYVQKLLIAFKFQESDFDAVGVQPLLEPLSERELEVLQLIANGLTNKEIADRLYLSLHTIKVHASNIYGKLGVNSRMQAGARARELGILDVD